VLTCSTSGSPTLLQGSLPSHLTRNERLGFRQRMPPRSASDDAYHAVHASFTGREGADLTILVAIRERNDRRRDIRKQNEVQVTIGGTVLRQTLATIVERETIVYRSWAVQGLSVTQRWRWAGNGGLWFLRMTLRTRLPQQRSIVDISLDSRLSGTLLIEIPRICHTIGRRTIQRTNHDVDPSQSVHRRM
jgi:hypothetical protein